MYIVLLSHWSRLSRFLIWQEYRISEKYTYKYRRTKLLTLHRLILNWFIFVLFCPNSYISIRIYIRYLWYTIQNHWINDSVCEFNQLRNQFNQFRWGENQLLNFYIESFSTSSNNDLIRKNENVFKKKWERNVLFIYLFFSACNVRVLPWKRQVLKTNRWPKQRPRSSVIRIHQRMQRGQPRR